ncbi:hypothetical protein PITCH_A400043 [uncultured Desulfobacterium sp.]|uniref:DegT/DnrJ/EryC1/StrS aminotransferase family protein n=1 Tax=uncultured Desulfobacterium sp. TaxID=201089 RepID=A0A445MZT6_9BACT|nr:hypothetical protein PITCH_A400043 [uncultured Desulfobacterium sp.]
MAIKSNKIDDYFLSFYGRKNVFVPSGRFGLYAIFKCLFSPGDRVIISPVTCKSVILALFSSGLIPVFVDIDENSGNIDVEKISDRVLSDARGIVTTNLYGTPDRAREIRDRCRRRGLFLIEDCCHIVDAKTEGLRVGSIGDAAVFSFSKFLKCYGGVVLSSNLNLLNEVSRVVEREGCRTPTSESLIESLKSSLIRNTSGQYFKKICKEIHGKFSTSLYPNKKLHTKDILYDLLTPLETASLLPYHKWLSYSGKPFDKMPSKGVMKKNASAFDSINEMVCSKKCLNNELIRMCPLELKKAKYEAEYCNLVVPYYTKDRNGIIQKMEQEKGVEVWYIYDPPLDLVFDKNSFVNEQIAPEITKEWTSHILPINSEFADDYLDVINSVAKKCTA